jgi:dTDP-4-amino-4,6-dideoxygalactose transaminase
MTIPLLDLKAQYKGLRVDILAAIAEVLETQVCIGGPKVAELEQKIAAVSDCKYAVGVSSGTDALLCSLMALDIGPEDEVITTPFTFFATAGSVARLGAKPVFVDIDEHTYNLDPAQIEKAITARTKAIIPVHLFGQMCDMDSIMEIADRHGLAVVEDAAQSITATYKGRKAGSIGNAGCFSFFPSKNLGGVGDGGMIVTNDAVLYEKMVRLRNHGAKPKYYHKLLGGNFRLDPLQAAVLLVKLPYLETWSEQRRKNAQLYNRLFAGSPVRTAWIRQDCVSIFNQYSIVLENRSTVIEGLKAAGISSEIYYPLPLHKQECFAAMVPPDQLLPIAEETAQHILSLPIYPELTTEMIEYIASTVLGGASAA